MTQTTKAANNTATKPHAANNGQPKAKPQAEYLIIHPIDGVIVGRQPKYHLAYQFAAGFRGEGEPMPIIARVEPDRYGTGSL